MLTSLIKKIFGSANDRFIRKTRKIVTQINALEVEYEKLTDEQLKEKTAEFKKRLNEGETLDHLLVEAFAVVREAGKRVYGMRLFDVQMIGGYVLHKGMIAEMKTGEGKTFVALLSSYLNGLSGAGVHVVTVNDYLASYQSRWAARLLNFLGLTVGCIIHGVQDRQRQQEYAADITYGTNHEFGFDYLRDNMKFRLTDMVQRPFNYAIVDEADSILIDEARTPLIISGSAEDSSELYAAIDKVIPQLKEDEFEKDEKQRNVMLTDAGVEHVEELLRQTGLLKGSTLYDVQNISLVHHVNSALRAHKTFTRDVDYIVKDDKVVIIDEFTGRMMEGRRYSDGLHQALEAKEGVTIEMENQTLASITYQNYFRIYKKLACMTGTAMTEAAEFEEIYKLHTVSIPTNMPMIRLDHEDDVYLTAKEKYDSIIKLIKECNERKQPVLVGTTSIEKSEYLSKLLKIEKVPHQVLNARHHEQEATIVAQAGCSGAITIATNMAGRGTDIKLGGNVEMRLEKELADVDDTAKRKQIEAGIKAKQKEDEALVISSGGLFVIGTERHESRRIDNQLRGRSGRQGDPGASKFFVSLEDDLMRIFGSDRLDSMLRKLGVAEGEAISHAWISKALERAQQKVEARNFDIRKHLLRYDDVMNDQRKIIYQQRLEIMKAEDMSPMIEAMRHETIQDVVHEHIPENALVDDWDLDGLHSHLLHIFNVDLPVREWANSEGIAESEISERAIKAIDEAAKKREEEFGSEKMRHAEKSVLLRALDTVWKEHLLVLDHLRQGINLRAYAQSNPLNEYKREAFTLFQTMLKFLREDVSGILSRIDAPQDAAPEDVDDMIMPQIDLEKLEELLPGWLAENAEALSDQPFPEIIKQITRALDEKALQDSGVKIESDIDFEEKPKAKKESTKKPASTKKVTATAVKKTSDKESKKNTDSKKEVSKTVKAAKSSAKKTEPSVDPKDPKTWGDLPRNADCPCGSGKKYKHCHGAI